MAESSEIPDGLESLFNADGEGPAAHIDAVASQALIDGVLLRAHAPVAIAPARRGVKVWWLLAAALVLTGSAAAMYAARRGASSDGETAAPRAVAKTVPAPAPVPAQPEPSAALEPNAPALGSDEADTRPDEADTRPVGPREAQDLLQRANRLRGDGDYRGAERMYVRAIASGNGPAAYSARVAAADLRVEQFGDARGALRLYREALRAQPGGPLAPEIHEGMAQAYRKLGATADERRSLQALLEVAGSGPSAERARQRLQQLDSER